MWSSIEASTSVVCASLPCYGPLLKKGGVLRAFVTGMRSLFSLSKKTRSRSVLLKRSMPNETSSSERTMSGPTVIDSSTQANFKGSVQGTDLEMGQIRVETDVNVESITKASEALARGARSPCIAQDVLGDPSYDTYAARKLALDHIVLQRHTDQCMGHCSMVSVACANFELETQDL